LLDVEVGDVHHVMHPCSRQARSFPTLVLDRVEDHWVAVRGDHAGDRLAFLGESYPRVLAARHVPRTVFDEFAQSCRHRCSIAVQIGHQFCQLDDDHAIAVGHGTAPSRPRCTHAEPQLTLAKMERWRLPVYALNEIYGPNNEVQSG